MPCWARVETDGRSASGYWVEKMYVDLPASRDGGREIWALPKQLARFDVGAREVAIECEDGPRVVLDLALRGPALPAPATIATVQDAGEGVVRFRGSGRTSLRSASMTVREANGTDEWMGFARAKRVPGAGVSLVDFTMTMHPPRQLAKRA
jgi:hypothetical protein